MNSNLSTEQMHLCDICANVLFNKEITLPCDFDVNELLKEANHQAVLPMVCTAFKKLSLKSEIVY